MPSFQAAPSRPKYRPIVARILNVSGPLGVVILLQEWFHFVEQEKQKRQQLALEVDQLTQDSVEIRDWAFQQV